MILLCLVLFLSCYLKVIQRKSAWRGLAPPSPPAHYILGHIPTMAKLDPRPQLAFHDIALQFGNLVRLQLGRQKTVLVSGFREMKELHENEVTENRADLASTNLIYRGTGEKKGILFNVGEEWKQLRRFTLICL